MRLHDLRFIRCLMIDNSIDLLPCYRRYIFTFCTVRRWVAIAALRELGDGSTVSVVTHMFVVRLDTKRHPSLHRLLAPPFPIIILGTNERGVFAMAR